MSDAVNVVDAGKDCLMREDGQSAVRCVEMLKGLVQD